MVVMKVSEQTKPRVENSKKNNGSKAILVAQEISFAKVLAGNDKKLRDRGVKRLRKWLSARSNSDSALEHDDFMRLWKGLFYCMWMADKPLVQEELAETISSLVHTFNLPAPAIKFVETFFRTLCLEWQGIDQHRLEKFLMFVRRFLRQSLFLVERRGWDLEVTDSLCKAFESTLLPDHANLAKSRAPLGLVMHFAEIFLEELAKVSKGELNEAVLLRILQVFAQHIAAVRDARMRSHITRHIFYKLIEQSPVGQEFQERFRAWKKLGFPGGSIDVMQKVDESEEESDDGASDNEVSDEEVSDNEVSDNEVSDGDVSESDADSDDGETHLDPRAGAVNVELPLISFDASSVAKLLEEFRFKKYANAKTRKHIADIISKFEELAKGECPIGMKKVPEAPVVKIKQLAQDAAVDLLNYESELLEKGDSEDESLFEAHENGVVSEDEDQTEEMENGDDSEDDAVKDNEVLKKTKRSAKRKASVPEKKVPRRKKALLEEQSEENSDEVVPKASKKNRAGKTKLKNKAIPEVAATDTAAVSKVNCDVKRVDSAQISNAVNSKVQDKLIDEMKMTQKMGTGALLQHIAPHLTGINKSNRRASCGGKLQTPVEDTVKQISDSPTSQGKKIKKRKSVWDEPLQDGEYEIFIPKEEIVARKKRLSDANVSYSTPQPKVKNPFASPAPGPTQNTPSSSSKKVNFVLQRNRAQAESEYFQTLRENPEIPYDANKEPPRGVLKPSPYSSPVNPFYKRKLHI